MTYMKRWILLSAVIVFLTGCGDNEMDTKIDQVMKANKPIESYHLNIVTGVKPASKMPSQETEMDYKEGTTQMMSKGQKNVVTYINNGRKYILTGNRVSQRDISDTDYNLYHKQLEFLKRYKSHFNVAAEEHNIIFTSNRHLLEDKKAMKELGLTRTAVDEFSVEYVFNRQKQLRTYSIERLQKEAKKMHESVYTYSKVNQIKRIEVNPLIKEGIH